MTADFKVACTDNDWSSIANRYACLTVYALVLTLSACTTLPTDYKRESSSVIEETGDTTLGQNLTPLVERHDGKSGFEPLINGVDALVARMLLAGAAERSLDVQYYIWHDDDTGKLLLNQLLRAADRGVRVRLLLDDYYTATYDLGLVAVDNHPKIQVRVFNPWVSRKHRRLESLTHFRRINRRMHNKSFTADNQVTIVGGRNIGDVYFNAREDYNYLDFDVAAIGPVVNNVSKGFDRYWNSEYAVPIAVMEKKSRSSELEDVRISFEQHRLSMQNSAYASAAKSSVFLSRLKSGELLEYWGEAKAIYDDPDKVGIRDRDRSQYVQTQVRPEVLSATSELIIISAYFVPAAEGMRIMETLSDRGVRIRVLTNSLASNDVPMVHAGYARYRKPMLRAGVELHEFRRGVNSRERESKMGLSGVSEAGLHSKFYIFDRRKTFVGSFNLDPRSRHINTEMGILIDNAAFSEFLASRFDDVVSRVAYKLQLDVSNTNKSKQELAWLTEDNGTGVKVGREPNASVWRRMGVWFLSLFPIESQL